MLSQLLEPQASDIRDSAEDSAEDLDAAEAGADAEEHGSLSPEFIHGARVAADGPAESKLSRSPIATAVLLVPTCVSAAVPASQCTAG